MKTRTVMLKDETNKVLEFDINPSEITVTDKVSNTTANIDQLGEILIAGKRGLKEVSIKTFLPAYSSRFKARNDITNTLNIIESWKNESKKLRVIITNPTTNFLCLIENVNITYKEGQKDLYIEISIKEYKEITIPTVAKLEQEKSNEPKLSERSKESAPKAGKTEVVNKKTTLWGLACKYYGNGNEWKKIAKANGNINPKKLKEGATLIIPT